MKKLFVILTLILALSSSQAFAHCEVPCGIYGDDLRISLLKEHQATIEKAIKQIVELGKEKTPNYNQIVRWINTKEAHAVKIQDIVNQYFLTQRIKILDEKASKEAKENYQKSLEYLHKILVYAMKCKQSTDLNNSKVLDDLIHNFAHHYLKK